ncbi:MAG TPA: hypothetical protein VFM82_07580 [Flavobacteriaceae bacterium]|nr:hypothetical protein [Flavobacteriaceae bacterium]
MKNIAVIIVFCAGLNIQNGRAQDLNELRSQYIEAISEKSVCEALIEQLRQKPGKSSVHLAYLGTLETVWAKYVFNPILKMKTFKNGKEKIEQAVNQEPENMEIRYLRLSVQKNIPGFLGYNDAIEKDFTFLEGNIEKISSNQLREMILAILKN